MKKIILSLFCIVIIIGVSFCFVFKDKQEDGLTTVKVAEVAHSIFYAPQYVAIAKGFFEEEGLEVDLSLANGADAVMAAVLSGDVDIGFCGTEATIYVYNGGEDDYPVTFAGLTKRDGSYLVAREEYENFTLEDLEGKYVIGGRQGGMPEMTFEWALRQNGIDPNNDLTIDTSIAFASMQGAFIGGTGDFVTLFQPNALEVEKQGLGHIVAYVGTLGGEVPYTAYNARKSFIEENEEVIVKFSNAIDKALKYVQETDSKTVASYLVEFFPDTSLDDLATIVEDYKVNDAWRTNITIKEEEFNHIQEIITEAGELEKTAPYEDLIYTEHFENYE